MAFKSPVDMATDGTPEMALFPKTRPDALER
jgi:hypothetical protein